MVGKEFPQVRLVESEINGGYAYANNLGLRALGFAHTSDEKPSESTPRTPTLFCLPRLCKRY
jgi:hypothetical protein